MSAFLPATGVCILFQTSTNIPCMRYRGESIIADFCDHTKPFVMKLSYSAFLLFFICSATACDRNSDATLPPPPTSSAPGAGTFTWVEGNAGAGTAIICDSAYASAQFKTIFAFKGGAATRYQFEINLSSLSAGNYSVATNGNAVAYIRPGSSAIGTGTAGGITISANANNELSGNGVVTMPTINDRVYITMNKVPLRP